MRAPALLFGLIALALTMGRVQAQVPPVDPDVGLVLYQAAAFDGKLWLLGETSWDNSGTSLVSFDLASGARVLQLKHDAVAILQAKGHLWLLRSWHDDRYIVSEWRGGAFRYVSGFIAKPGEPPGGLVDVNGEIAAYGMHMIWLYSSAERRWRVIDYTPPKPFGAIGAAASSDGSALFLGFNRGEWGGDVLRLDLTSGAPGAHAQSLCGPDCEPVNAIVTDTVRPGCVIVAFGAMFGVASGRISRACGGEEKVLFSRRYELDEKGDFRDNQTVPFFSVVSTPDFYWAVSDSALFRISPAGEAREFPLPKFDALGGFGVGRDPSSGIILVKILDDPTSSSTHIPFFAPAD